MASQHRVGEGGGSLSRDAVPVQEVLLALFLPARRRRRRPRRYRTHSSLSSYSRVTLKCNGEFIYEDDFRGSETTGGGVVVV